MFPLTRAMKSTHFYMPSCNFFMITHIKRATDSDRKKESENREKLYYIEKAEQNKNIIKVLEKPLDVYLLKRLAFANANT